MFMRRYDTRSLAGRQGLRCLLVNLSAASLPFEFNIFFLYKEHNIQNEYKVILY